MRDCERYENMLSLLLDGELGEREKAELSAHVAGCEHCGELAVAYAAVSGALSESLEELPADLHDRVMDAVALPAKANKAQRRFLRARPVLAAAACVVVIAGTVLLANRGFRMGSASSGSTDAMMNGAANVNTAAAPETNMNMYAAAGASIADTALAASAAGDDAAGLTEYMLGAAPEAIEQKNDADAGARSADMEEAPAEAEPTYAATEEAAEEDGTPAPPMELEVEAIAAVEGGFAARVLSDPNGYFAVNTAVTVLTDEAAAPGARFNVVWHSVSVGAESGAYYVTAEEISPVE